MLITSNAHQNVNQDFSLFLDLLRFKQLQDHQIIGAMRLVQKMYLEIHFP